MTTTSTDWTMSVTSPAPCRPDQRRTTARILVSAGTAAALVIALGLAIPGTATATAEGSQAFAIDKTHSTSAPKQDSRLLPTKQSKAFSAAADYPGGPLYVRKKTVHKLLLSAQQAKAASGSSLVASLAAKKLGSFATFGGVVSKRFFVSSIYAGKSHKGAVPSSIAVIQLGAKKNATYEISLYAHDPIKGVKVRGASSSSITRIYKSSDTHLRISQTVRVSGSAVVASVCSKAKGHKASIKKLSRCSEGLAKAQRRQVKRLFVSAPSEYVPHPLTASWTPTVATDTSPGCAAVQPSDPTTFWCGINILPAAAGTASVEYDKVWGTATYGSVSQSSYGGKMTIFYRPKRGGPYTDVIRYRLGFTDSSQHMTSGVGTITIHIGLNSNYTLTAHDAAGTFTPSMCGADWCTTSIYFTTFNLVTGTSGIYYDVAQVSSANGFGSVTTEFNGANTRFIYQPFSVGPFTDQLTFRVGNQLLGVWSNTATITLSAL
jgi:hypothetical protein